jgi:hypothetical protein
LIHIAARRRKCKVFDGGTLALDETAEVKEEDVRNKSTKLMWQF